MTSGDLDADVVYMHGLSSGMIESCDLFDLTVVTRAEPGYIAFNGDPGEHARTVGDVQRFCAYLEKGREEEGEAWKTGYGAPIDEIMRYLDWRDGRD